MYSAGVVRKRPLRPGVGEVEPEGTRDPHPKVLGHLLTALVRDHQPQLGLEVVGLEARGAGVEVVLNQLAPFRGELAVEVEVQLMDGVTALALPLTLFTHAATHPSPICGCLAFADEAPVVTEVIQPLLQGFSSAMQPAHDGADGDVEDFGDFLVREALHVAQ